MQFLTYWQYEDEDERLKPELVYGSESETQATVDDDEAERAIVIGILTKMAPWNGSFDPDPQVQALLFDLSGLVQVEQCLTCLSERFFGIKS